MKDEIEEGDIDIQYCPTKTIWSDILNKPKQRASFRKDRAMLMKVPVKYKDRVAFLKMNPALLPNDIKNNLGALGINRSRTPSRSVLGDFNNRYHPGIMCNEKTWGFRGKCEMV